MKAGPSVITVRKSLSLVLAVLLAGPAAIVSLDYTPNAVAVDADLGTATPVAFTVNMPDNYRASANAEVLVHAWPSAEVDKRLSDGETFTLHKVPADTENIGGSIAVRVAPGSIPSEYVNANGMVDFQVQVVDRVAGWAEMTELTSRSVPSVAGGLWADPLYSLDELSALSATAVPAPTVDLVEDGAVSDDCEIEGECIAATRTGSQAPAQLADTCIVWGTEGSYVGPSRDVWAKVGATMALGAQSSSKARMTYSGSREHSTSAGIAFSKSGASYSRKGTKTVSATWGYSFARNRDLHRSYQIELRYGRYQVRYVEYDSGCGGQPRPGYGYKWRPRLDTGGVRSVTKGRPNAYTECVPVEDGTWYRQSSAYKAYSNSAGVDISGAIGIDLSSASQFATTKRLEYDVAGNKQMCGRSTVPSRDSVQMLRFR